MPNSTQCQLERLGAAVREGRHALGVSQEDFAEICDLHRTYIGQVERGEVNISFENIAKISAALKINISELMTRAKV
jgi:transcriptional regulator with XRE-family HTH domain